MPLEMGHADQDICHMNGMSNGNSLENGFINFDFDRAVSSQAVSDEDRGVDRRFGKAVLIGGGEMGDRLAPGPDIEGIRIGQEGFSFIFLYPVHDLSSKD